MLVRTLAFVVVALLAGIAGAAVQATTHVGHAPPGPFASVTAPAPSTPSRAPAGIASPFVAAVARVRPAVVNISTVSIVQNPMGSLSAPFFGFPSGPFQQKGIGSGVIVDANGAILTNAHVVEGANQLTVTLLDGRTFKGTSAGSDTVTDLAVVKIPAGSLPTAPLGDSSALVPGDWVIAIGNPYGLNFTVTHGVISATGRALPGGPEESVLQTDAAINPGNSGGALVNTAGQVIGINTAIYQNAQGIGFAIPINSAKSVMQQLLTTGHVVHPYLGVYLQPVTPAAIQALQLPAGTEGAIVVRVVPGSPAASAGLKQGDVIVQAEGKSVNAPEDLISTVRDRQVGSTVTLQVFHGGAKHPVRVKLGQAPPTSQ
jgi:S1-C subfamily serine protease